MNFENMVLGIELGSTRIKGVLIDENHNVAASGSFSWENSLVDGVWTYKLEDAVAGVRACYAALRADAMAKFGKPIQTVAAIGISGMMHGYLVLDKEGKQIAPFRTWRNTMTARAADRRSRPAGRHPPGSGSRLFRLPAVPWAKCASTSS